MGLASKGPSLPLPQAWIGSWLPFSLPSARVLPFLSFGVELDDKEFKLDQKNVFYAVSVCSGASGAGQALARRQPSDFWRLQALSRRWPGAGPCLLAPPGAGKALGRRWADLFWENGHCDFIHRWIELKFGYVVLNP